MMNNFDFQNQFSVSPSMFFSLNSSLSCLSIITPPFSEEMEAEVCNCTGTHTHSKMDLNNNSKNVFLAALWMVIYGE